MPDALYSHPRLARVYDPLDPDRSDLDAYLQVIEGVGAKTVLDVGCGTGTLISMLTELGLTALGVDPAEASIDVAREKVVSDLAEFVVGTVVDVAADPSRHGTFDLAAMTANVAQVFLDNDDWLANLCAIKLCLRPGGHIIFETRQPADRGWERWTKEQTHQVVHVEGEGSVEEWVQVTKVDGEFVTFESPTIFHRDGERIEVRDLPYAPGRGWLILAKS